MPELRARVRSGTAERGGILGYPLNRLYEEVAFVAYHFHWALNDILNLEHGDRQRFVEEISAINRRMNETTGPAPSLSHGTPLQDLFGM